MYTNKQYSLIRMIEWTWRETILFILIALVPLIIYEVLDQKWLHLPWLPIALVGTAVAFILGFQNNATYDRIWEARKIWGGIVNTSRSWGIMVNDFISNVFVTDQESSPDRLSNIRKTLIYRHIAWLTALRHAMRQPRKWEHFLAYKSNRKWARMMQVRELNMSLEDELTPLLSPTELGMAMNKSNVPTQLIALQSKQLLQLREENLIDDFRHIEMEKVLVTLYDLQGKSERIKNFPYPRQYATLNMMFVWIFLLLLPFGVMYEFDKIGQGLMDNYPLIGNLFVWLSIPFSVVVMWVFHTMERVGKTGENPFEGTANDVPITTISRGIEIDLREMIDEEPDNIPGPLEPRFGVQT
jgi:putative membrane protein